MHGSVVILVSCLTSLVLGENISGHKEKGCTFPDHSRGVCKPSSECLDKSTNSIICSSKGDIIYVCCKATTNSTASYFSTGRAESPRVEELNGHSKTKNNTSRENIGDRFFYGHPIAVVVGDGRGINYNYNHNNSQEGWYLFKDRDVYSFDVTGTDWEVSEEEENVKYPWETYTPTTRRLYYPGNNNYERREDQKYPSYSNRPTTGRPYYPGNNNYERREDQKYPSYSNIPTTGRPYYPGNNNYEQKEDQKYPSYSNRPTTGRPYYPGNNNYEQKEEQKQPWNSGRRTTIHPTATRRTTESSNKKQRPVTNTFSHNIDNPNRKRISEIKCQEYSELVTQTITGLPLVPNPSPIEVKVDECKNFQSLIVGGKNTSVGEFPHMAAVGFLDSANRKTKWFCGGSLISEQYVLTAGHCALSNYGKPVKVRLGEYNLNNDEDGAYPEDYPIAEVIVHPDYKRSAKYNDIALLKLSRRVKLRKDKRPACLHTESIVRQPLATAIGWGRLERAGEQSEILQKVSLNIIDKRTCRNAYSNVAYKVYLPQGIVDSQLCAGELSGNKDTCQGDSGGPLEVFSENNFCIHYVIGITSFGKSCGAVNSPGVYTRVSSYVPWIESIVWPKD